MKTESEITEFEPRLKSAKDWFKLSSSLNLETLSTILSGTNHTCLNSASRFCLYSRVFAKTKNFQITLSFFLPEGVNQIC